MVDLIQNVYVIKAIMNITQKRKTVLNVIIIAIHVRVQVMKNVMNVMKTVSLKNWMKAKVILKKVNVNLKMDFGMTLQREKKENVQNHVINHVRHV